MQKDKNIYIFLNIDGVLNNMNFFRNERKLDYPRPRDDLFNEISNNNVWDFYILLETLFNMDYQIHFMLNSTWAKYEYKRKQLDGLFNLFDLPKLESFDFIQNKQMSILNYMQKHNLSYKDILIIDDENMYDDTNLLQRYVQTNVYDGFNLESMYKAIEIIIPKRKAFTWIPSRLWSLYDGNELKYDKTYKIFR